MVLAQVDRTAPTRQHEPDDTDQGYICPLEGLDDEL